MPARRFLTDAVRNGAAPLVLAGATGGRLAWRPGTGDDPQAMVHEEIPRWCAERGFDTSRLAWHPPVGLWCGRSDGLYDDVRALADRLPEPAAAGGFDNGRHTRRYWNGITPAAFAFLARRLNDG